MKHRSSSIPQRRVWAAALAGLIALALGAAGCSFSGKMRLVTTAPDAPGFVEAGSQKPFVPWGTNYYDPNTGWPPQVWQQFDAQRVSDHFKIMSVLGANCARVFLAAATFQPDPNTVDEQALAKLDTLVEIARSTGVRLILTGPDHWEGEPAYWKPDRFAGEEALKALEKFWTVVGERYRDEPAILAWDLLNEPQMPWAIESWGPRWNDWLAAKYQDQEGLKAAWGDELEADQTLGSVGIPKDLAKADSPRLLDWQRFREHLADQWVQRQVQVLRRVDPAHMITVGYIQWSYPSVRPGDPHLYSAFNPHRQAQWLDFISIHFYPLMGNPFSSINNWERNLAYLQGILAYCHTGKPVVLGEYGWYGGGAPMGRPRRTEDQQKRWISAEIEASRRLAQGWLSWPFADSPDSSDMSIFGGMVREDFSLKVWGKTFNGLAQNLRILPQPTPELPKHDFAACLTAPLDQAITMHQEYAERVQKALEEAGPPAKIE
ncbi:MAG: beta-galactosidase [Phycisphaerales bacterium]|nr:MAG: beta-galactosidase [Phycisphaerales bacterium]